MNYKRYINVFILLFIILYSTGCKKNIDSGPLNLTGYYIVAHVNINGQPDVSVPNVIAFTDTTRGVYIWLSGHVGFSYKKINNTVEFDLDEWNGSKTVKGVLTLSGSKVSSLIVGEIEEWQNVEMIKTPASNSFINNNFIGMLQNYHSNEHRWVTEDTLSFFNNRFEKSSSHSLKKEFNYTVVNNGVAYGSSSAYVDPWVLVRNGERLFLSHLNGNGVLSYGALLKK